MKIRDRKRSIPIWRAQEHAVALIEKLISPNATVVHDVRLPVIGSSKRRKRQCDVVVYSGHLPRQHLSIVEVQKRARKVGLNDFGGWLLKLEQVGAHALIAVSERGFDESVREAARKYGDRVKLLTLDTQSSNSKLRPFFLDPSVRVIHRNFEILKIGAPTIRGAPPSTVSFSSADRVLSVDEGPEQTLNEMLSKILNQADPDHRFKAVADVDLAKTLKSHKLWVRVDGTRRQIEDWPMTLQLTCTISETPMTVVNAPYLQEGVEDPLAWLSQAAWEHEGGQVGFSIAVRRLPSGEFALLANVQGEAVRLPSPLESD